MSDLSQYKVEAPKPVSLEGRFVTVEPFDRQRDLQGLWDGLGGYGVNDLLTYFPQDDFSGPDAFGDWLEGMRRDFGWIVFVFREKAAGAIVGMATYMRPDPKFGVVEVGCVAHGPAMQRSALSTEAHYLMARHVFEDLGYRRYEWKCHNANEASKATALRLGFSFEGVFRQHMISKGANRDTAWFSMIDTEWPALKAAFRAWLSPDNFDAGGGQRRKLQDIRNSQTGGAA